MTETSGFSPQFDPTLGFGARARWLVMGLGLASIAFSSGQGRTGIGAEIGC
jgi:hypothetical protein